jgi:hypothetical protein
MDGVLAPSSSLENRSRNQIVSRARRSDDTNVASFSGNPCCIEVYVATYGLCIKAITIDSILIYANSARFKAECRLLHIRMCTEAAAEEESQLIILQ